MGDIAMTIPRGKGQLIYVGVPLGLGVDERPHPVLARLIHHLLQRVTPVRVTGNIEWVLNRLDDGRWVVALLNNSGVEKPQHGIVPTRHEELRGVTIETEFIVARSEEWLSHTTVEWKQQGSGATGEMTIPAGAVRLLVIQPAK